MSTKYNKAAASSGTLLNTKKRDYALLDRYRTGDERAGAELINLYENLLQSETRKKHEQYPKLEKEDLYASLRLGFIIALNKFDTQKNKSISAYARSWMKDEASAYILTFHNIIPLPEDGIAKKIFYKRGAIREMIEAHPASITEIYNKVAQKYKSEPETVQAAYEASRMDHISLNEPVSDDEKASPYQDFIAADDPSPEDVLLQQDQSGTLRKLMNDALDILNERQRHVFEALHMSDEPPILKTLSDEMHVSIPRIHQLDTRAKQIIRDYLTPQLI